MLIALVIVNTSSQPALAGGGRWYSVAYETQHAYALTGVYTIHAYTGVTISGGTNCTIPYASEANPIYLTQWVQATPGVNEVEIGVGYQCGGFVYRFWGYRSGGNWYSYGTEQVSPDANRHYFDLNRFSEGGTAWWHYRIDGVEKFTLGWNIAGVYSVAGLETTHELNNVQSHWFRELQYTWGEGPWNYFDGITPPNNIRIDQYMCGGWVTPYSIWKAAQNNPC